MCDRMGAIQFGWHHRIIHNLRQGVVGSEWCLGGWCVAVESMQHSVDRLLRRGVFRHQIDIGRGGLLLENRSISNPIKREIIIFQF